jgi:hypothetical protein
MFSHARGTTGHRRATGGRKAPGQPIALSLFRITKKRMAALQGAASHKSRAPPHDKRRTFGDGAPAIPPQA